MILRYEYFFHYDFEAGYQEQNFTIITCSNFFEESRESLASDEFIPIDVQNEINKKNKKTPTISPEESSDRRSSSKLSSKSKSPIDIIVERKKSGKSIMSSYEDFNSESN